MKKYILYLIVLMSVTPNLVWGQKQSVAFTEDKSCVIIIKNDSTIYSVINVKITPSYKDCPTGRINITMTGGFEPYTYVWSNGQTKEDISNLLPGEYTVTVPMISNKYVALQ